MKKLFSKRYLITLVAITLLSIKVSIANPIPVYDNDNINLNEGWNLISLDVIPVWGTEPESVFGFLISSNNLQMVTGFQNNMGVFFDPNGPSFLNTLQNLVPGEGYWVKVQNADVLSVEGVFIEDYPDFSIDLKTGWNLVGYLPAIPQTTADAFASLIAAGILQMVTSYEQGGKFYNPNGPPFLNTLTEIKNSFGYWVKVSADYYGFTYEAATWVCGDNLLDSRDGKTYNTVQIGTQCWMRENLNIGTQIDGTTEQTNNGIIEKYCYNNLETNCDVFGGLYQFWEMAKYSTPSVQGICPTDWHLSTDEEWTILTNFISNQPQNLCNSQTSYIAKSLAAKTIWNTSTNTCAVGNDLAANNATNFFGLPGGYFYSGDFYNNGYEGVWWSAPDGFFSWFRFLYSSEPYVYCFNLNQSYGYSVRCLMD